MPLQVGLAVREVVEIMAADAKAAAPATEPHHEGAEQYPPGSLKNSIEARSGTLSFGGRSRFASQASSFGFQTPGSRGKTSTEAYGIWAAWYYLFTEFGTVNMAATPWLMPAVEAHRAELETIGRAALVSLVK